jgi:uncharacterized protein YcfL
MRKYLIFVLFLLLFVGCAKIMEGQPAHIVKQQQENFVLQLLPPNSTVVETLNREWYVVEIKINEKPKRFLFRYWYVGQSICTTLTELNEYE